LERETHTEQLRLHSATIKPGLKACSNKLKACLFSRKENQSREMTGRTQTKCQLLPGEKSNSKIQLSTKATAPSPTHVSTRSGSFFSANAHSQRSSRSPPSSWGTSSCQVMGLKRSGEQPFSRSLLKGWSSPPQVVGSQN